MTKFEYTQGIHEQVRIATQVFMSKSEYQHGTHDEVRIATLVSMTTCKYQQGDTCPSVNICLVVHVQVRKAMQVFMSKY